MAFFKSGLPRWLLEMCVYLCVFGRAACAVDYCSTNTFTSNSSWLQFTKEASTTEYAVKDKFKSLHCCAKGYRSIEWFKDSRAYPWASDVSSFILYPEAANQTVNTQQATESDGGNYTCLLRNDTHNLVHTIILASVHKPPPAPRATFTPTDQWVEIGHPVRLYCEAFVGRINLPDARSDISWRRVYPEGVKPHNPNLPQDRIRRVHREDGQIIGAYFIIDAVRSEDYGQYLCSVANGDSLVNMEIWLHHKGSDVSIQDNPVPWVTLGYITIILVLVIISLMTIYLRFGKSFIITFKDIGIIGTKNDNKGYDVLVLYTEMEAPLVGAIIPILQEKYQYKCTNHQISYENKNWYEAAAQLSSMSRSLVAVISPAHNTPMQLKEMLAKFVTLVPGSKPIIICLQELPKVVVPKDEHGENLQILLKKINYIFCQNVRDKNFWLQLRALLPSRNNSLQIKPKFFVSSNTVNIITTTAENNQTDQCNKTDQRSSNDMNDAVAMV